MAWRIDEHVIRGEIDNRMRGRVRGRIWFAGREEPVALKLEGNCWRDLAGRKLEFSNPEPKAGDLEGLAALQDGVAGDITASRKVKVPDIPMSQIGEYYAAKKPFPWHWGNSLYLEWFSARNGRVVIETASFELKIGDDAAWEMTEEQENEQRKANGTAMTGFMDRLVGAAGASDVDAYDDTPEEWNTKPQTEEEAEAMQARSDLLGDRVQARLDREGESADFNQIVDDEIDRMRRERGEPEPTEEDLARNAEWIEEVNRDAEEALANPDPEVEAELHYKHPLAMRASDLTVQLMRESEEENWVPDGASNEHPVAELVGCVMCATGKLAGALNGKYWPPSVDECAGVIVRLKKARGYLDDALRAAESCQEEKLLAPQQLGPIVVEVVDIAHEADALIAELREKLERGTD
ncbi:MAG TPA: hypothetical protein VMM36_18185 [Opitutaceae bacterium]|nr:hypothetical protein [Opitutaceae bacterium]